MAAKALKCNECTKEFTSVTLAQFHATKTGHQDFSESNEVRPELSAEEKTLKLEELRHILAEKKIKDKAAENARNLELEIQRRKSGVATQEARRELKEKEIAKAAEQLKREKMEDKLRLQRIRAEIEAERRERKNLADQKLSSESTVPESIESTTTQTLAARNGDIRIQIKYPGGTFKTVLKDEDNLSALVDKLATEACLTLDDASCLVVPFPRRVIKICDCLQSTLIHLGLSPSASLNLESL